MTQVTGWLFPSSFLVLTCKKNIPNWAGRMCFSVILMLRMLWKLTHSMEVTGAMSSIVRFDSDLRGRAAFTAQSAAINFFMGKYFSLRNFCSTQFENHTGAQQRHVLPVVEEGDTSYSLFTQNVFYEQSVLHSGSTVSRKDCNVAWQPRQLSDVLHAFIKHVVFLIIGVSLNCWTHTLSQPIVQAFGIWEGFFVINETKRDVLQMHNKAKINCIFLLLQN